MVTGLFNSSGGYQLAQKGLGNIVQQWQAHEGNFEADEDTIVEFVYRCRVQMVHLRSANLNGWTPPMQFQALRGWVQIARIDGPSNGCREKAQAEECRLDAACDEKN